MKRILLSILPLMAALFLTVSCDPTNKNNPEVQDTLTVSPTSLEFESKDASTKLVNVTTEKDWTATPSEAWIHLERTSGTGKGTLAVKVDANPGEDRSGSISVKGSSTVTVSVTQSGKQFLVANPDAFDGTKRSSTTYQLLIYTFADSNGDGVGDFKGIQNKLDYLDGLGVTAIWLSPLHPTSSYHGYDVNDYATVNPKFGSESDFKALVEAAHQKNIAIYMDYVLNHSGFDHPWFKSAVSNPESPYRDFYIFSADPAGDIKAGRIPMLASEGDKAYNSGEWYSIGASGRFKFVLDWVSDAAPTITVTRTDEAPYTGKSGRWLYFGNNITKEFRSIGDRKYDLVVDFDSDWGFLVRTSSTSWNVGEKYGTPASQKPMMLGSPFTLAPSTSSYDPGNVPMGNYYHSNFDKSMPDLNYGPLETAANSPAFLAVAETADRWINEFNIDGFRLDAVKHIYHNQGSNENPTFLAFWYDRCNQSFRMKHDSDMFMVGEVLDSHSMEKNYYKGLPSLFEFGFRDNVLSSLKTQNGSSFAKNVVGLISDHKGLRAGAVTSLIIGNHDITRVASELGEDNDLNKAKQAAAMLLTAEGKPFIYQGDELGYRGDKSRYGDEHVRMPIRWDRKGNDCAKKGLPNGVDDSIVKESNSVEYLKNDAHSIYSVYQSFSRIRNTYPALAEGVMSETTLKGPSIASWYMTSGSQRMLVIHNLAVSEKPVEVTDDLSHPVVILGSAYLDGKTLTLGPNSSVVFKL